MKLGDAFFNWLQMHIVSEARPEDEAAKETLDFFALILREDHGVSNLTILPESDDMKIWIGYEHEGEYHRHHFDRESAEKLLDDINSNPIYNNQ
ncbi:hypothetical protein A8709_24375 [Paenibacillus pectinilyticus]|uniref:Uncharacterized protein n=1 Tax=Paenibacillus pectinilyticus TaxID=512399 RepID=A0A1C1A939_9BACL|nr:hypothetical protein [Paenibacillus pectinilyticus]OCT17124.1 hypothetical protein A8709_24375 [Paenibacillus pectinilyticus]